MKINSQYSSNQSPSLFFFLFSYVAIYTYSGVWKGKTRKPSAYFATPIRLSIAPNEAEMKKFPFKTTYLGDTYGSWLNNFYFTLTSDINSEGVLAVTNFGDLSLDDIGSSRLPNYSFLAADSLGRFGDDFISGVVAYNGLIVDDNAEDQFEITRPDGRTFDVTYVDKSYTEPPTIVASPNWFSLGGEYYPQKADDINFAIRSSSTDKFTITAGEVPSGDVSYFGFNFLVISAVSKLFITFNFAILSLL